MGTKGNKSKAAGSMGQDAGSASKMRRRGKRELYCTGEGWVKARSQSGKDSLALMYLVLREPALFVFFKRPRVALYH